MREDKQQGSSRTPFVEKVIGTLGLLLVLLVTSYLIFLGSKSDEPPELIVEPLRTVPQDGNYLVEIQVRNIGGRTAQEAVIEGRLMPKGSTGNKDAKPRETSETTFSYAPPSSERRGGLFFQHNPQDYELELRAKSYICPS